MEICAGCLTCYVHNYVDFISQLHICSYIIHYQKIMFKINMFDILYFIVKVVIAM